MAHRIYGAGSLGSAASEFRTLGVDFRIGNYAWDNVTLQQHNSHAADATVIFTVILTNKRSRTGVYHWNPK